MPQTIGFILDFVPDPKSMERLRADLGAVKVIWSVEWRAESRDAYGKRHYSAVLRHATVLAGCDVKYNFVHSCYIADVPVEIRSAFWAIVTPSFDDA